jgi:ABC-type antimicrobial peptide transport system permease subunit
MQIVGVAKDARYGGLKRNLRPVVYVPYNQGAFAFIDQMTYEVRTSGEPLAYVNTIREIVHQMDAGLPVANITTQAGQIDGTISQEIMFGRLSSAIAFVGLSIACVGLYGAVAYSVARRTSEIGIRVALGARRGRVMLIVLRKVMFCTVAAVALGLPLCLLASRQMESFLFGIKPQDPLTITIAVAILLVSASLAAFIPAQRAARIDPLIALRHE